MYSGPGERKLTLANYAHMAGTPRGISSIARTGPLVDFVELIQPKNCDPARLKDSQALYEYLFPNPDERTPWGDITKALSGIAEREERLTRRRYHVMLGLNDGKPVLFNMFCTLPMESDKVAIFWLYVGVADAPFMNSRYNRDEDFRRHSLSISAMVAMHGLAEEDSRAWGRHGGIGGLISETEFIGQAGDDEGIRFTRLRLHIHRQNGALPVMLETEAGDWITPMIQPSLETGSNPLVLHFLYGPGRIGETDGNRISEIRMDLAKALMDSYIFNYQTEPYDQGHIREISDMVRERFSRAKRALLVPPEMMPDIVELAKADPLLKAQVQRDFGPLEAHREKIIRALGE